MENVSDFLDNQNSRIQKLRNRLNLKTDKEDKEDKEEIKVQEIKKKAAINTKITYICIIAAMFLLFFLSALDSININIPKIDIKNIFDGGRPSDAYDDYVKIKL